MPTPRLIRWIAGFAAALLLACAAQAAPVEGREYQVLSPQRPVPGGNRIEVIEFFYYGCPICYEAQPHIARWLNKVANDVMMRRVPAISNDGWEPFARSFYTLETMGEIARLHWPIYDNFHFDGKDLKDEATMLEWVGRNALDTQKFKEIWHSAEITEKIGAAHKMLDTYNVRGVPTFVVDGKYVTSARMAGGTKQMMEVVDVLVNRARSERK